MICFIFIVIVFTSSVTSTVEEPEVSRKVKHAEKCCPFEPQPTTSEEQSEEIRSRHEKIRDKCIQELESSKVKALGDEYEKIYDCRYACVYNAIKVLDDQGNLNEDETLKLFFEVMYIPNPETIENSKLHCWRTLRENEQKIEDAHVCSTATREFLLCTMDMHILHCDDPIFNKEESCVKTREELKKRYH
ncbi:hypothetical protein C0J52_04645 [Blattella germanica]|nr:hypothetical protein C0J52_04645 [Blattella germanica]